MKLSEQYPDYKQGLFYLIGNKSPMMGSDDSKLLSYCIGLKNFSKGFDFYELRRLNKGGVQFSLVTMLGFKTIVETTTPIINQDLEESEWSKLIFKISTVHFTKEEYRALKMGYIKKTSSPRTNPLYVDDEIEDIIRSEKLEPKFIKPLNENLEYLLNKPREELSSIEKFMKSNDEFLQKSLEVNNPYKNKSGCLVVFLIIAISLIGLL